MPEEIRRIRFTFAETAQALNDYARDHGIRLPEGHITRARLGKKAKHEIHTMREHTGRVQQDHNVSEADDDIIITFFDDSAMQHNALNLSKAVIAAVLIDYCIDNKILLPKQAQKSIAVDELYICMDIELSSASDKDAAILSLEED